MTVEGADYLVTIPAASTADLAAGTYRWAAYLTDGSDNRYTAASGVTTVDPDLSQFAEGEGQTHNEKMLALAEAALEERLTGVADGGRAGVENYAIDGMQASLIPTEQLIRVVNKYRRAVARERNPWQANPQMLVKFVRPGA